MEETIEKLVTPMKELNELTLRSMEQITAIQLKAFQDNAKIGMYALNTATEVKDIDSLNNYLESQIAVGQWVSDNVAVDVQEISQLGKSFAEEAKVVVEKSITQK